MADRARAAALPALDALGLRDFYANGSFLAMRKLGRAPLVDPSGGGQQIEPDLPAPRNDDSNNASPGPHMLTRALVCPSRGGATEEDGLLLMAFNTSLAQQYETLQARINGTGTGVGTGFSAHTDPLTGPNGTDDRIARSDRRGVVRMTDVPLFGRLRWGLYLFAPSKKALEDMGRTLDAALTSVMVPDGRTTD